MPWEEAMAHIHIPNNLGLELESDERDPNDRWALRQTAIFVLVVCGAFWGGVGLVVYKFLAH